MERCVKCTSWPERMCHFVDIDAQRLEDAFDVVPVAVVRQLSHVVLPLKAQYFEPMHATC